MNATTPPSDGSATSTDPVFSAGEVAFLLRMVNDASDKVYALLSGIRSMMPVDSLGEHDDPAMATLVQMAMDEVADIAYQRHFMDRLPADLRP